MWSTGFFKFFEFWAFGVVVDFVLEGWGVGRVGFFGLRRLFG